MRTRPCQPASQRPQRGCTPGPQVSSTKVRTRLARPNSTLHTPSRSQRRRCDLNSFQDICSLLPFAGHDPRRSGENSSGLGGGGVTGDEPVFIFQGEKVNGQWPRMTARVGRGGILGLAGSTNGSESGAQSVLSHRYLGGREFLAPASQKRT